MKKLLAVLLAVVMLLAAPAAAMAATTDPAVRTTARTDSLTRYAARLIDRIADAAGKKGVVADARAAFETGSNALLELYRAADAVPTVSAADLRKAASIEGDDDSDLPEGELPLVDLVSVLSQYVFVQLDDPDALAELIAEGSVYDYQVVENGKGTVIIRVNIAKHPELLNPAVFAALVEKLYAAEQEEMLAHGDSSTDYLMSYEHIAGELALHALVWAASNEVIRLTGSSNDTVLSLYRSAVIADLDYAESRLPSGVIEFLGQLIILTLKFDFASLLG